jgi:hypothetical protein
LLEGLVFGGVDAVIHEMSWQWTVISDQKKRREWTVDSGQ